MINNRLIAEWISGSNLNLVATCSSKIVHERLLLALADCDTGFIAQCPMVAADSPSLNRSFKVNGSAEGATATASKSQASYCAVDINGCVGGKHTHAIVHSYLNVANSFTVECICHH